MCDTKRRIFCGKNSGIMSNRQINPQNTAYFAMFPRDVSTRDFLCFVYCAQALTATTDQNA